MINTEAVPGAAVRQVRPDGELWDARGVIKHVEGHGALVRWEPPAQPGETWVPDITWLALDEEAGDQVITLTWHKERQGSYFATDATRRYSVASSYGRAGASRWLLQIRELTDTAGVRHALGQPVIDHATAATKAELVAVANAYSALGDDYQSHEHGYRGRLTEAIGRAYDAMREV
jgi:hypothetical protein